MSFIANLKSKIGLTPKKRLMIICYLLIFIFFLTAFQTPMVNAVDDNYSTYLYNQDINVDNDKAHLLTENSDGSNSYRNLFQSDFLFPAKLQNDMISTQATSTFAHYSFNQYYFDNLNHQYNYQSSNPNDNLYQDVDFENDYDLELGNSLRNGSIDDLGYNATYTFDNYNETESNYGYYSGSGSFNYESIGNTPSWINVNNNPIDCTAKIISEFNGHKNVLELDDQNPSDDHEFEHYYPTVESNRIFEFYLATSIISEASRFYLYFREGSNLRILLKIFGNDFEYRPVGLGWTDIKSNFITINTFFHVKLVLNDSVNTLDCYINGVLEGNDLKYFANSTIGIDKILLISNIAESNYKVYMDAPSMVNENDTQNYIYKENDNNNAYGVQLELENDFDVVYGYNSSIHVLNENSNHYDIINISDNSENSKIEFQNSFSNQISGSIEGFFKSDDISQYCLIYFGYITSKLGGIHINDGYIRYFDSDWNIHDIKVATNGIWYSWKIVFNCTSDSYDIWFDGIKEASDIEFFKSRGYLNFVSFESSEVHFGNNYNLYLDNLDYSWTYGYYENRITELNGHKFETEIESEHTYILYPNYKGMDTGWTPYPSGSEISCVDDTNDQSDYIHTTGGTILFEFQDLPIEFTGYNFYVDVVFTALGVGAWCYTTIHYIGAIMYYPTGSFVNYTNSRTFSFAQINAMYISFAGNPVPDILKVSSVFMVVHYSFNEFKVNYEQEFTNDYDLPVSYELLYLVQTDTWLITDFSIYNYDIEQYTLFNSLDCYENSDIYSFVLNESAYFRFNKIKVQLNISHNYYDSEIIIDYLIVRITYVVQNDSGYQELILYNFRYDDIDDLKGYSRFELQIYNDSIKYRYSEINLFTDDYIYSWIEYNTSNIEVNNIEVQSHIRYGLNTLDIEIINFYYIIYINYDVKIEFREQSRKELETHKIKSSFNFTSYNTNYLDLTGIIGNYSYNSFKGCRSLYGATSELFHRYFTIPFFSDDIDVSIPLVLPTGTGSNPSEPSGQTGYFWTYESFQTEYYQTVYINTGNWSVEFRQMRSVSIEAKYYYEPKSVSRDDLGSWKWKIKFSDYFSYTVDFNFMRNAITSILNLVLLFAQWIGYLIVGALSYVFMYLGTNILVFLWNYLIYYIFIGLITVLWYLYNGLYLLLAYIWEGLIWVYENLLIPAYIWITEVAIPYLIEFVIIPAIAFTLTLIIWILTLGRLDFWELYELIEAQLFILSDSFNVIIIEMIDHIVEIMIFIALYLLLIMMCFLKHIVVKVRGYINRSKALEESLNAYLYPIILFYKICLAIKQLIANWF